MNLTSRYSKLNRFERRALRLKYIQQQKGKCWYCHESLDYDPPTRITTKPIHLDWFPKGFLNTPIHLQHDHKTDLTEGVVHAYCNAVLWEYEGK